MALTVLEIHVSGRCYWVANAQFGHYPDVSEGHYSGVECIREVDPGAFSELTALTVIRSREVNFVPDV